MAIKLKHENVKETVTVRDEVQAAAFIKAGFVPASKAEAAKLNGENVDDSGNKTPGDNDQVED